jgi:uncharacterized protein with von Willebrand factor type A (vWA) domain
VLGALSEFVEELRAVGVPVSMVEALDAAEGLRHVDLADREALRATLAATLVKNEQHTEAFRVAFDVFFGLRAAARAVDGDGDDDESRRAPAAGPGSGPGQGAGGGGGGGAADDLLEGIAAALAAGDEALLRALIAEAVERFAGIEPGRPVGGRYYFYRVMRRIDPDRVLERLRAGREASDDVLAERLADEAAAERVDHLRTEVRREIVRRLIEDRGAAAVAKTLRTPLVEDLDLMHATREELDRIERAVVPLARKLATRLAQRRRQGRKGRLDVRGTIRRSLAHGGVLLEPRFRPPRRSKPEIVLLCDVSGSMATFARFTMQLTYAIGHQFSKVRSFAFIDGIDEVTRFFESGSDFHDGVLAMGREARLVWRDGHSDYGNALAGFAASFADAVTARTTLIVAGDARNNYRDPRSDLLSSLGREARALFWLNPEARRYWNTGDSIMATYAAVCDGVFEVRTLRQLERFVETVALPVAHPASLHDAVV